MPCVGVPCVGVLTVKPSSRHRPPQMDDTRHVAETSNVLRAPASSEDIKIPTPRLSSELRAMLSSERDLSTAKKSNVSVQSTLQPLRVPLSASRSS